MERKCLVIHRAVHTAKGVLYVFFGRAMSINNTFRGQFYLLRYDMFAPFYYLNTVNLVLLQTKEQTYDFTDG